MSRSPHLTLIERIIPIALLIGFLLIAFMTLYPFLPAILWGAMVAIAIEPRYRWLVDRLRGRNKSAAWLTGLFLALLFIVPMIGLARALLAFLPDALSWIEGQSLAATLPPPERLDQIPAIGPHISAIWQSLFSDASGVATHFGDELKVVLLWALQEVEVLGVFVFEFGIGVILAVLLVYRAERITELSGKFLDRIGGHFAQRLAAHSVVTTRQAVRGVLGAALAQTLVATFSYVVAGIPGWIIWAGLTFILSLVQIGPVLIWLPMSIWLWASDQTLMALFVFFWGLVVVNLTDNIVRPLLVAKDSDMPASLAFLGAVGGLLEWGVVGVFLGPVIVAVAYELILKWIEPDTLPDETIT
jgi:predicted PurR-regulated permease PerM